jgi:hypothetical protein
VPEVCFQQMYYVVNGPFIGDDRWVRAEDGLGVVWYDANGKVVLRVPSETDAEVVLKKYCRPDQAWEKSDRIPGEFHPRMQREPNPRFASPPPMERLFASACASAVATSRGLFIRADELFRFVEPDPANLQAFGHELRHLLILACTEVESGLKAVLEANETPALGTRYTIRDYQRLVAPMRLAEWKVKLRGFPSAPELQPFADWTAALPPSWWSAHNAVKHNREQELSKATFKNVLDALAAVYVVVAAQFGVGALHFRGGVPLDMTFVPPDDGFPRWRLSELYVPPTLPGGHDDWSPIRMQF